MLGLIVLSAAVVFFIAMGFWVNKRGYEPKNPRLFLTVAMCFLFAVMLFSVTAAFAQDGGNSVAAASGSSAGLGFLGAALSTGLACVGAGIAVAFVGSAALGVVGEKPTLFGTTLIYMGLAEGIAIYGLVISLFILNRI